MNVYSIKINGLGFNSDNILKILGKDLDEAYKIAADMTKVARENLWEDIELVEVSLECEITDPEEFKKAKIAEGAKAKAAKEGFN